MVDEHEATGAIIRMINTPEFKAELSLRHAPGESREEFEERVKELATEIGEKADWEEAARLIRL